MLSKNCGITKPLNAFYGTRRLKLLGRKIMNFHHKPKITADAFFDLCLLCRVFKGRKEPLSSFWESENGSIFPETILSNKFRSILTYIRFEDKNSRPIRRRTDKYAAT